MIFERAKKEHLSDLTLLWQVCFGDEGADIRHFWDTAFDKIQVYHAREGKKSLAMLCVMPTQLIDECGESRSCGYFYAVCTAPEARGKGLCAKLMRFAEQNCDCDCAALVPAEESLFEFYRKMGYQTAFYHKKYFVSAQKGAKITRTSPGGYRSIRELQLYGDFVSYGEWLLPLAGELYRIETDDGVFCACAVKHGSVLNVKELLPDEPKAAAALAAHLGCECAEVRTDGGETPFGMCKALNKQPLPDRAYLALAFD